MKTTLTEQDKETYNRIIADGSMDDMFEFGNAVGRVNALREIVHEQKKLTDGFIHPTDCTECRKFKNNMTNTGKEHVNTLHEEIIDDIIQECKEELR